MFIAETTIAIPGDAVIVVGTAITALVGLVKLLDRLYKKPTKADALNDYLIMEIKKLVLHLGRSHDSLVQAVTEMIRVSKADSEKNNKNLQMLLKAIEAFSCPHISSNFMEMNNGTSNDGCHDEGSEAL